MLQLHLQTVLRGDSFSLLDLPGHDLKNKFPLGLIKNIPMKRTTKLKVTISRFHFYIKFLLVYNTWQDKCKDSPVLVSLLMNAQDLRILSLHFEDTVLNDFVTCIVNVSHGVHPMNCKIGAEDAIALWHKKNENLILIIKSTLEYSQLNEKWDTDPWTMWGYFMRNQAASMPPYEPPKTITGTEFIPVMFFFICEISSA